MPQERSKKWQKDKIKKRRQGHSEAWGKLSETALGRVMEIEQGLEGLLGSGYGEEGREGIQGRRK